MPIRLLVTINAASGTGSERAQAMRERLAAVRQEPGCEQYDLFQNTEDPDVLVMVERWSDQASLDAHSQRLRAGRPPGRQGPNPNMERYEM